jgi:hypothetical protein
MNGSAVEGALALKSLARKPVVVKIVPKRDPLSDRWVAGKRRRAEPPG